MWNPTQTGRIKVNLVSISSSALNRIIIAVVVVGKKKSRIKRHQQPEQKRTKSKVSPYANASTTPFHLPLQLLLVSPLSLSVSLQTAFSRSAAHYGSENEKQIKGRNPHIFCNNGHVYGIIWSSPGEIQQKDGTNTGEQTKSFNMWVSHPRH